MATTIDPKTKSQAKLGFIGQLMLAPAGVLLALPLVFQSDALFAPGVLAGVLAFAGLILVAVAWLGTTAVFGPAARVAAWATFGSLGVGFLLMIVIPGDREWGKLGAMVSAAIGIGVSLAVAGVAGGIAFLRARPAYTVAGVLYIVTA